MQTKKTKKNYIPKKKKMPTRTSCSTNISCRNLSLGFATRAKGCKVVGQEESPGVMSHVPGNVRKCQGIDLHLPKGTPTLGVGTLVDSQIFRG